METSFRAHDPGTPSQANHSPDARANNYRYAPFSFSLPHRHSPLPLPFLFSLPNHSLASRKFRGTLLRTIIEKSRRLRHRRRRHPSLPHHRIPQPQDLQANGSLPTSGGPPATVDFVFLDFLGVKYIIPALNSLGGKYTAKDIKEYLPTSFTTTYVFSSLCEEEMAGWFSKLSGWGGGWGVSVV